MWIEAIVMPSQEAKPRRRPARRVERHSVYESGRAESERFRDSLLDYLRSHKLMSGVRWVSEPGSLPLVTLECEQQVLEELKRAGQFEAGCSMMSAPLNSL